MSFGGGGKRLLVDSRGPYGHFFEGRHMVNMKHPG